MTLAMWLTACAGVIVGATFGLLTMSVLAAKRIGEAYERGYDRAQRELAGEVVASRAAPRELSESSRRLRGG